MVETQTHSLAKHPTNHKKEVVSKVEAHTHGLAQHPTNHKVEVVSMAHTHVKVAFHNNLKITRWRSYPW